MALDSNSALWRRHDGICFHCGHSCVQGAGNAAGAASRDHLHPRCLGARYVDYTHSGNIVLSCFRCNQAWAAIESRALLAAKMMRRLRNKLSEDSVVAEPGRRDQ